ncbi:MAG: ABC transporter permease [Clostridiales bacterium]
MTSILKIEIMKLKRSSVLSMMVSLALLPIVSGYYTIGKFIALGDNASWDDLYNFSIPIYTLVILPTLIIISFAMISRIEYLNNGWKQYLCLPVSKTKIYISKLLIGSFLIFGSILVYCVGYIIAGFMNGLSQPINYFILLKLVGIFVASLPVVVFQYFLSMRFANLGLPLGIGFTFMLPNFMVAGSDKYYIFYPWSYPYALGKAEAFGMMEITMLVISIVVPLLMFLFGLKKFISKDII